MSKLEVGDKVVYTHNTFHSKFTSTIVGIDKNGTYHMQMEEAGRIQHSGNGWNGEWVCSVSNLRLVNKGENMSTKQYNLGDVIEVKNFLKRISQGAHPEYKDGELFVVVDEVAVQENSKLKLGQIVRLGRNDNSSYPYFDTTPNSNRDACIEWGYLAELPVDAVKKAKAEKPVALVTRTEYSDGVIVSEEAITFDGKTFTREDLKKLVTRYQEVLRRPVATVIAPKTVAKKKASKK